MRRSDGLRSSAAARDAGLIWSKQVLSFMARGVESRRVELPDQKSDWRDELHYSRDFPQIDQIPKQRHARTFEGRSWPAPPKCIKF